MWYVVWTLESSKICHVTLDGGHNVILQSGPTPPSGLHPLLNSEGPGAPDATVSFEARLNYGGEGASFKFWAYGKGLILFWRQRNLEGRERIRKNKQQTTKQKKSNNMKQLSSPSGPIIFPGIILN